jgi:16S rRNA (adenine1518-N6/adenine1519-N6)-dimethyltransferase
MKLSEMRQLLDQRQIQLTKSLGQNFLHDQNILQKIVALGRVETGDKVLEIGPGLGPLTAVLLEAGAHVLAIEKDKRLVPILEERFARAPNLELLTADALGYLQENPRDWADWKLVANLPYSVASPIMVELALARRAPKLMAVTLQLEVAQRIAAQPGSEHYGQLSLFLQVRYRPGEMFKIPASCFFPPPDVDSGCIVLDRRDDLPLEPEQLEAFVRLVKRSFSERRKMMAKLLKREWPAAQVEAAFGELGISLQERAENLSLDQFVRLTHILHSFHG